MDISNEEKCNSFFNSTKVNKKKEKIIKGIKKASNDIRYDKVVNNVLNFFKKENKKKTVSTSSALPTHAEQQNLTSRIFKDLYPNKELLLNKILKKINILNLIYLRFLNEEDLEDVFNLHKELFPVNYHADFYFSICNFDEKRMTPEEIRRANEKAESLINSKKVSEECESIKKKRTLKNSEEKKIDTKCEQMQEKQTPSSSPEVTNKSIVDANTNGYTKMCININNNNTEFATNVENIQNITNDTKDTKYAKDTVHKGNNNGCEEQKATLNKKWHNDQIFSVGAFLPFSFIDYINSEHLDELMEEKSLEKLTEKDILLNYLKFIIKKKKDKEMFTYVNSEETTKKNDNVNHKSVNTNIDQEEKKKELKNTIKKGATYDIKKYIEYKMDRTNEKEKEINQQINDNICNNSIKIEEIPKEKKKDENIKNEKRRDYLIGSISVLINYEENKRHRDFHNINNFFINKYNMCSKEKNCFKYMYDSSKQFLENYFINDNAEKVKDIKECENEKEDKTDENEKRKEKKNNNNNNNEKNSLHIKNGDCSLNNEHCKKQPSLIRTNEEGIEERVNVAHEDHSNDYSDILDYSDTFYKNIMHKKKSVFDNLMIVKKQYINSGFKFEKKIFEEIYMNKNIKEATKKYIKKKITSAYILTIGTHEYFRGLNLASFLIEYTIFYFYFVIYKLFLFSKKMYCYVDNQVFYSLAYNLKDTQNDNFEESVISDNETDMGTSVNDISNISKKKSLLASNEKENDIYSENHHSEIPLDIKTVNIEENQMINEHHLKNDLVNEAVTYNDSHVSAQTNDTIINNTAPSEKSDTPMIALKTGQRNRKNRDIRKNYSICNSVLKHCYKKIVANDYLHNLYDIIQDEHFKDKKSNKSSKNDSVHIFNFHEFNNPFIGINLHYKILHFFFNNFSIHTLKNKKFFHTQNICRKNQIKEQVISQLPLYMYLHVIEYNKAAINLYNKLNFYYICTYDNFYDINKKLFSSFLYAYFF